MGEDVGSLVRQVNALRMKQLNGGGLSYDELREGIRLTIEIRKLRAGKKETIASSSVPQNLSDLF